MSKRYYIRISEDEPLPVEKGLSFELNTQESDTDKLFVLSDKQYNSLIARLGEAVENFEDSDLLESVINSKVESMDLEVPLSTNSLYVKHPTTNEKYGYDDLEESFSNIEEEMLSLNSSKADNGTIISLQSNITDLSNVLNSHTHDDRYYTESEINTNLNWKQLSLTNMSGCALYYNKYFCHFIINKSTTLPKAGVATNLVTGTIPPGYRPKLTITRWNDGASTANVRFKVTDDGAVQYLTEKAFSSSSNFRCVFTWARI